MTKEVRAKTFKSGNSVALRLPKALGIKEGVEMKVREEQGRYVVEPVEAPKQKIDFELPRRSHRWPEAAAPRGSRNRGTDWIGPGSCSSVTEPRSCSMPICCIYMLETMLRRCAARRTMRAGEVVTSAIVFAEVARGTDWSTRKLPDS